MGNVDSGDLVRVPKNLDREILVHVRYRFGMTVVAGTRKRGSLLRGFAAAGDWGRHLSAGPSAKQQGKGCFDRGKRALPVADFHCQLPPTVAIGIF
jgi:hypothetical protein